METDHTSYQVLALKYRPKTLKQLIGQDAFVRTLTNAFRLSRVAQAYMLTGIRGIGKTSSARIIARALNCKHGPTVDPCLECEHCLAIDVSRHIDVYEMDAASHTGIADMRDILESVPYHPLSARFKIYIIDEVHMLSEKAFNSLLKTLEEPPPHIKFIFATTETRKVPITVISRCQKFDLRQIETSVLFRHFTDICSKESIQASPEALRLITHAAQGSVRDGLSLLDQAIALGGENVTAVLVKDMLGLTDQIHLFDLLQAALSGNITQALEIATDMFAYSSDPLQILRDLLELTSHLTRFTVTKKADPFLPLEQQKRILDFTKQLSVPHLTRVWQILLKGLEEAQHAPVAEQAVEMILIRLAFASTLPTPTEIITQWQQQRITLPHTIPPDQTPTLEKHPHTSLSQVQEHHEKTDREQIYQNPIACKVLQTFPGSQTSIRKSS